MRQVARFTCYAAIRCASSCICPETKGQVLVLWYPFLLYCVCTFLPPINIAVHNGKPNTSFSPEMAEGAEWELAWINNGNLNIWWENLNIFSEGSSKPNKKGKRMLFYLIPLSPSFPFATSSDFIDFNGHKTWSRIAGSWIQADISFLSFGYTRNTEASVKLFFCKSKNNI